MVNLRNKALAFAFGAFFLSLSSLRETELPNARYEGFSHSDIERISKVVNPVVQSYHVDKPIVFLRNSELYNAGRFSKTADNTYNISLEDIVNYSANYSNTILGVLPKRDVIDPLVLHELGHTLFDNLPEYERKRLFNVFYKADSELPDELGKGLTGHASYLSYFFRFYNNFDGLEDDDKMFFTDEQFAETFAYISLAHEYQDNDQLFIQKKKAVTDSLKKIKR